MKKIILLAFLVGGLIFFFLWTKKSQPEFTNQPIANPLAIVTTKYLEFSPTVLTEAANSRRVLFFYASWCPPCRPADTDFRANETKIPEDVLVIRVNYNDPQTDAEETALAKKYQITYQHTFVQIDSQDNPVTRWNGGSLAELLKNIKS